MWLNKNNISNNNNNYKFYSHCTGHPVFGITNYEVEDFVVASTPPLSFLQVDALPAAQPTASKHSRLTVKKG